MGVELPDVDTEVEGGIHAAIERDGVRCTGCVLQRGEDRELPGLWQALQISGEDGGALVTRIELIPVGPRPRPEADKAASVGAAAAIPLRATTSQAFR